jgi:hypothetical protein
MAILASAAISESLGGILKSISAQRVLSKGTSNGGVLVDSFIARTP